MMLTAMMMMMMMMMIESVELAGRLFVAVWGSVIGIWPKPVHDSSLSNVTSL